MFAGASGSLCCLGQVPGSTLGGFFLFSLSFLTLVVLNMNLLPCWKRLGLMQRITLGSHITTKVMWAGECPEGVVRYLGVEGGAE